MQLLVKFLIVLVLFDSCVQHKGLSQRRVRNKAKFQTKCIICPGQ